MFKRLRKKVGVICALLAAAAVLPVNIDAARVVFVSFHSGDNTPTSAAAGVGFTSAPDAEYTRLLQAAGHEVTRYQTTATPDTNFLNGFDLVMISRSVPSGHYQTDPSPALWNGLTKPTMILGGYVIRANRLGYAYGDTIPDTAGEIRLQVNEPTHPIFTGVSLDGSGLTVNPYAARVTHNGALQAGISVVTAQPVDGSVILATVGTDTDPAFGGMIIGEFPAGTMMGNATMDIAGAKRLVFLTGSREAGITSEASGIFDLSTDGARMFLNAVNYMTGQPVTEPPPLITNVRPASGTTLHYAPIGLSFEARSGTAAGIPAANISVVLNGTDVTPALTIGGTAQARTISYANLAPNTVYTGVITVKDASDRTVTYELNFDTLAPFALPTTWAHPTNTAVASAAGVKARFAQTYDVPVLANTAARAEAQLAGTLIDPAVNEPYPNFIAPSTDNADGSYNYSTVNFSVEAGLGVERGNFQAPTHPDQAFPSLSHNFNIAVEVIAFLELTPGRHFMGVNSDDGFVVSSGFNGKDLFARPLGRYDGGRGSADTIFQFDVTEAGLYPFRLVYYQGDGGGNLEWFTMDPLTGEKVLINDRPNAKAIRAWRQVSVPERPYVASVSPAQDATNVDVDSNITIRIQEVGSQINTGSVALTLNGQTVAAQTTRANGVATVTYDPAQALLSDTDYTVGLTFTDSASNTRTITSAFRTEFVPPTIEGANIAWVSFHEADDIPSAAAAAAGFTNAPDVRYTKLLQDAGHTVTRYVTTATPDVAYLQTFDVVIISRSVGSAAYQTPESVAAWHSLTNPVIILGGYITRANRLGLTTGDTMVDNSSATVSLSIKQPSHPIFSGIQLDAQGTMANPYASRQTYNGTLQLGISVNNNPVATGGQLLATVATAGDAALNGMVIAEYPAGTVAANSTAVPLSGDRLVFLTGSRESGITGDGAGIYDLEGDGARMFLNAVSYMAGIEISTPTAISLTATRSGNNIVISWPEAGSNGYALQATTSLSAPNWQAVAGTATVANGQRSVTVPTDGSARFFRLIQQ